MKKQLLALSTFLVSGALFASPATQGHDADVFLKPYLKKSSHQVSMHIGSTLPRTMQMITAEGHRVSGLGSHFREIAGKLAEGQRLVITAPASYEVVFTDATTCQEEAQRHIAQVLNRIGTSQDRATIENYLSSLTEVQRATFAFRNGQLELITDAKELQHGEKVWRKVPTGVVENYYHSEEEYLVAIRNAGLTCEEVVRPCFFGNVKYRQYRASISEKETALGEAYIDNNPFTIYYVVKRG